MGKVAEVVALIFKNSVDAESTNQKFQMLQKEAYESGDRETMQQLKILVDNGSIKLSSEVMLDFRDSLYFLFPEQQF